MLLESLLSTKTVLLFIVLLITLTMISGCSKKTDANQSLNENEAKYQTITASEAKNMMEENKDIIILDVRTLEEYNTGYIEGATLLPNDEILDKAEDMLKDKSATIMVYCRSGRRSEMAAQSLSDLGYTNVYDFGGIIDWSYDIVTK